MTTKVASIYFAKVLADRPIYGGKYVIPAVPRGGDPEILVVPDKLQRWQGPYALSPTGTTRSQMSAIVNGEAIARDIVASWTQFGVEMNPDCHPGIWVVREQIPLMNPDGTPELDADRKQIWRLASDEEKQQMWDEDLGAARLADAVYAERLIQRADMDAEDPRRIPFISQHAKLAAKHYGIEREWMRELTSADTKNCPFCRKIVSSLAIKCPHCQEVIDYGRLEAQKALLKGARQAVSA